jgi:hypothetical protein
MDSALQTILSSNISDELKKIATKVFSGKRIDVNEGIFLYENAELGYSRRFS